MVTNKELEKYQNKIRDLEGRLAYLIESVKRKETGMEGMEIRMEEMETGITAMKNDHSQEFRDIVTQLAWIEKQPVESLPAIQASKLTQTSQTSQGCVLPKLATFQKQVVSILEPHNKLNRNHHQLLSHNQLAVRTSL